VGAEESLSASLGRQSQVVFSLLNELNELNELKKSEHEDMRAIAEAEVWIEETLIERSKNMKRVLQESLAKGRESLEKNMNAEHTWSRQLFLPGRRMEECVG